jgi:tetratricopeptide (TPR) repeat protein
MNDMRNAILAMELESARYEEAVILNSLARSVPDWTLADRLPATVIPRLSGIKFMLLADSLRRAKRTAEASELAQKAVAELQKGLHEQPLYLALKQAMAQALTVLGDVQFDQGKFDQSYYTYAKACDLRKELVRVCDTNTASRKDLLESCNRLARVLLVGHRGLAMSEADELVRKAMELGWRIQKDAPSDVYGHAAYATANRLRAELAIRRKDTKARGILKYSVDTWRNVVKLCPDVDLKAAAEEAEQALAQLK